MNILKWIGGIFGWNKKVPWARWSADDLEAARAYLEGKDPRDYNLDDWYRLIDWLLQRYLPDGVINTEAQYLKVRAILAKRIQANLAERAAAPNSQAALIRSLPVDDIPGVDPKFKAWLDAELEKASRDLRELGERAYRRRLLEQHVSAVHDQEEAARRLDQLRAVTPAITPNVLAFRKSIAELRQLQRDFGVSGLRKKIDIAQQLIDLPAAMSTLEKVATDAHADDVRDAIAEVRYLQERATVLGEALGKQQEC